MRVLAVNAGSSTLKLRLLNADDKIEASLDLDPCDGSVEEPALGEWLGGLDGVDAVGHCVVHGGDCFTGATRLDDEVLEDIAALTTLAPLHQPRAPAAMAAVGKARPGSPGVACFDTAFHARMPAAAATYALPAEWRRRWPLRRYGLHGLSCTRDARASGRFSHPQSWPSPSRYWALVKSSATRPSRKVRWRLVR